MPVINLHRLFKEWLEMRKDLGNHYVSDNSDRFRFIELKLAGPVIWTSAGSFHTMPVRKINIAQSPRASQDFTFTTQIQASVSNDSLSRIKLTETFLEGLNKSIYIPLDGTPVPRSFGLNVNLREAVTEYKIPDKKSLLLPEKVISSQGATAHVSCYENQYKGRFECKVAMSGNVMMHDVKLIPHTIAEIIKDLKYSGHKEREDLDAFSFDTRNDQVYFILTGEGEFQWPIERRMEVNWTA